MARKYLWLLVGLLCAGGFLGPSADRPLRECVWIDWLPESPHQPYRACFFGREGWGFTTVAHSSYKLDIEIFEFCEDEGKINYFFHHDQRKPCSAYTIERLDPPTRDFDRKLTLARDPNNNDEPTVYYTGPSLRDRLEDPRGVAAYHAARGNVARHHRP